MDIPFLLHLGFSHAGWTSSFGVSKQFEGVESALPSSFPLSPPPSWPREPELLAKGRLLSTLDWARCQTK